MKVSTLKTLLVLCLVSSQFAESVRLLGNLGEQDVHARAKSKVTCTEDNQSWPYFEDASCSNYILCTETTTVRDIHLGRPRTFEKTFGTCDNLFHPDTERLIGNSVVRGRERVFSPCVNDKPIGKPGYRTCPWNVAHDALTCLPVPSASSMDGEHKWMISRDPIAIAQENPNLCIYYAECRRVGLNITKENKTCDARWVFTENEGI